MSGAPRRIRPDVTYVQLAVWVPKAMRDKLQRLVTAMPGSSQASQVEEALTDLFAKRATPAHAAQPPDHPRDD